jgi:putative acetyltransferase
LGVSIDVMVRAETAGDHGVIADVVERAFGSRVEAQLVEDLRASEAFVEAWSLVAVRDEQIVGHVMVTYAELHDGDAVRRIPMLSPLAVDPDVQRQGIGGALVRAVAAYVAEENEPLIVLEGSPAYYGRLGFVDARTLGITLPLPDWAPREAGQVLRLNNYNPSIRGHVVYPPPFDTAVH